MKLSLNLEIRTTGAAELFIERAIALYNIGIVYDYSKVDYKDETTEVTITCSEHGDFKQTPQDHLVERGCTECVSKINRKIARVQQEGNNARFIKSANLVHDDKFDYSETEFIDDETEISIICPTHGQFNQLPRAHLYGRTCPKCSVFTSTSKAEQRIIDYITEIYDGEIQTSASPDFMKGRQELDIYLPEIDFAIEYNGTYWESTAPDGYHLSKVGMCERAGVEVLHVWKYKYEEMPSKFLNLVRLKIKLKQQQQAAYH